SALMDGLALQALFRDPAVDGRLVNEMCMDAAARELGFDPGAPGQRSNKKGAGQQEVAAEG
nr:hypothetical protein [Rubrobacteraceae bacterium]